MTTPVTDRTRASALRRILVTVIVAAFGFAAVMGIVALLSRSLGETGSRVLLTTAVVGLYSIAALCCAALAGRRLAAFGLVGAVVAVVAAAFTVFLIWIGPVWGNVPDGYYRLLWTLVTLTLAWSFASLLLLLVDRRRRAVAWGLRVTLALFAVVTALLWELIWADGWNSEPLVRGIGVLGILAALGAIVVPVLSILLPDRRVVRLPEGIAEALVEEAGRRGVTVEELVAPLLP